MVVNASVIANCLVEEGYSRGALMVRNAYVEGLIEIMVSFLLHLELLNALKYSGALGENGLKEIACILGDHRFTIYELIGT